MEKLGQTSQSRGGLKAVQKRTRHPKVCSTVTRSTWLVLCWPLVTRSLTLSLRLILSTYPTRLRRGLPSLRFRIVSAVKALRLSGWAEQGPTFLISLPKLLCRQFIYWTLITSTGTRSNGPPGAPTVEEIELVRTGELLKVNYYHAKYAAFRGGIHPHPVQVVSPSMFAEFLSDHPIDYAFVCIDQLIDGDSARQDAVYRGIAEAGVPFIDSGVSISLEGSAVRGAVTTSAYDAGSDGWKDAIPNARLDGGIPGYRNVQLPEVNAAAAMFAVMEWRRRTGQYVSESPSFYQKYRLEQGRIKYA